MSKEGVSSQWAVVYLSYCTRYLTFDQGSSSGGAPAAPSPAAPARHRPPAGISRVCCSARGTGRRSSGCSVATSKQVLRGGLICAIVFYVVPGTKHGCNSAALLSLLVLVSCYYSTTTL